MELVLGVIIGTWMVDFLFVDDIRNTPTMPGVINKV
jgi:hypothetical protein